MLQILTKETVNTSLMFFVGDPELEGMPSKRYNSEGIGERIPHS
jgi:hypothetical protein